MSIPEHIPRTPGPHLGSRVLVKDFSYSYDVTKEGLFCIGAPASNPDHPRHRGKVIALNCVLPAGGHSHNTQPNNTIVLLDEGSTLFTHTRYLKSEG